MKMFSILLLTVLTAFELGCGYGAMATTPATAGAMPTISQLMPNSATSSGTAAAMPLTINGTNFSSTAAVNWNTTALTTTFVSANQLMATVPGSALAMPASVSVTVTNPAVMGGIYGGGTLAETSAAVTFTIH